MSNIENELSILVKPKINDIIENNDGTIGCLEWWNRLLRSKGNDLHVYKAKRNTLRAKDQSRWMKNKEHKASHNKHKEEGSHPRVFGCGWALENKKKLRHSFILVQINIVAD